MNRRKFLSSVLAGLAGIFVGASLIGKGDALHSLALDTSNSGNFLINREIEVIQGSVSKIQKSIRQIIVNIDKLAKENKELEVALSKSMDDLESVIKSIASFSTEGVS